MAVILPQIAQDNLGYRIPDNSYSYTPPANTNDYFLTPTQKNFLYKAQGGNLTQVNIDFLSLDNLFKVNNTFKTI